MKSDVENLPKGKDSAKTRMCVATRKSKPVEDLIRIVLSPENVLVPDFKSKLPGRGAWVCSKRKVVEQAVAKGAFKRAFKTSIADGGNLTELIAKLLKQDAISRVSLAKKAGVLVSGAAKVERQIAKRKVAVLIQAQDGAADGKRKIEGSLKSQYGEAAKTIPIVSFFTTEELSLALGLENVIHAAVTCERFGKNLVSAVARLKQYEDE